MSEHALFNLSAGPVQASAKTLRALSQQIMYHNDPEFVDVFDQTTEKLKRLFKTKGDVIIMQGEALLGLEAAAVCTIEPGDKCLNLVSGIYGHLYASYIEACGGKLIEVRTDYDRVIDPVDVEKAFKEHPDIKVMSVCHSETPTGTLNPVQDLCPIAKKHGAISIVDAVSSIGGTEVEVDAWGIDICCIGPQKNLASSPGLAPIAVSEAAWEKMRNKSKPVRYSYMSMLDFKEQWLCEKEKRGFPYTMFTNEVVALNQALNQVFEEGLEKVIARHKLAARMARAGVKGMGLEIWPVSEAICGTCSTAVKAPAGIDEVKLRRHLYDQYRVMISGGYRDLKGKVFRIGHMGTTAEPAFVAMQLAMIEKSLQELGHSVKLGSGVGAALEVI
jgi:pyridoxamine---pyruvate transaminase